MRKTFAAAAAPAHGLAPDYLALFVSSLNIMDQPSGSGAPRVETFLAEPKTSKKSSQRTDRNRTRSIRPSNKRQI